MRLFAFFKTTALLLPLALFAGCASTSYPANPQYAVVCKGDAAFETGKNAYDAEIGGYWLYGKTGNVHIEPLAHALASEEKPADLVLNIRTAFDTHVKSDLKMVYIHTGKHIITARLGESAVSISLGDTAVSARTDILNNKGYIKFKEDGPYRKIILSGEFLERYAKDRIFLEWLDPSSSYPANPQYAVVCKGGVVFETGKNAYDAEIGGYWLYGKIGGVHIEPLAHTLAPEEKPADLVLNIRTAFDTRDKSDLKMVYINSGKHIITARPGESAISISPGDAAVSARTHILNNTGYIKFKEYGPHRKIILSGEFLKRYANSGALLKWFDR